MMISRNDETKLFGRQNRFILDDPESPFKMAYSLTKPLKLGWTYNSKGIYKFVLQEVQTTDDDNTELCIADYYKHFPRETGSDGDGDNGNSETPETPGKKVWL